MNRILRADTGALLGQPSVPKSPTILTQEDGSDRVRRRLWKWVRTRLLRWPPGLKAARARRILFLDDDPDRALSFVKQCPEAIWVTTVTECLARLEERWEEVHLDHDLGGRIFVDSESEDCGMEVIRWLCKEPRRHLHKTAFVVHTHNAAAGLVMVLQMRAGGYDAEFRPFGVDLAELLMHDEAVEPSQASPKPASRWKGWLRARWPFARPRGTESAQE
jgi:hypothetical protein